jgi:hypothetical protein
MSAIEPIQNMQVPKRSGGSRHWTKAYLRMRSHLDYLKCDTLPKDNLRLAHIKGFEEAVALFERVASEPYFKRRG